MSSIEISLITLLCLAAGFLLGLWLQYRLPDHHLSKESQDTIKLGAGMVARSRPKNSEFSYRITTAYLIA